MTADATETDPIEIASAWRRAFARRTLRMATRSEMLEELPVAVVAAWFLHVDARAAHMETTRTETEAQQVQMRQERDEAMRAEFLASSGIPPRYTETTFAGLDDRCPQAKADAQAYCADGFRLHSRDCLLLMGPPGTGKTALAVACLRQALEDRPEPIQFAHLGCHLERLRNPADTAAQSILDLTRDYQLVVLDDIGRQRLTEWGQEQAYLLIEALYAGRRHVVLTSNLTWAQWERTVDEAIRSRCREMCQVVSLAGQDRR